MDATPSGFEDPIRVIAIPKYSKLSPAAREANFSSHYTQERSRVAFEAYKRLRDFRDREILKQKLTRQLGEAASRSERRRVEQTIRSVDNSYNPQGGEFSLEPSGFEVAQRLLLELIGPVPQGERIPEYPKFGEYRERRENGEDRPINGFKTRVFFSNGAKAFSFAKNWRLDWDETKGIHFNVSIRPGSLIADPGRYLGSSDPLSLSLVLPIVGTHDDYLRYLEQINAAMTNPGGNDLDYLPITNQPQSLASVNG